MRVLKRNIKNLHVKSFLYWSLVILFSLLLQVALTPPLCAQRPPAANEVAVYEHINYVGNQVIYKLEPGMRQKLVSILPNTVDDKISSIQVGANVGVMYFLESGFSGLGNGTIQSLNTLPPQYNDKIRSLIIFPKEWGAPIGVLITGKYNYSATTSGLITKFFPAPEKMTDRIAYYPDIGIFNDNTPRAHVWPDKMNHPVHNQVFVKLCEHLNFGGKCITIPGPGGSPGHIFQLYDYQFSDKTSSLQVIHNYPVSVQQPTPARTPIRTPAERMPLQRR
jgi:hypothetical protein